MYKTQVIVYRWSRTQVQLISIGPICVGEQFSDFKPSWREYYRRHFLHTHHQHSHMKQKSRLYHFHWSLTLREKALLLLHGVWHGQLMSTYTFTQEFSHSGLSLLPLQLFWEIIIDFWMDLRPTPNEGKLRPILKTWLKPMTRKTIVPTRKLNVILQ